MLAVALLLAVASPEQSAPDPASYLEDMLMACLPGGRADRVEIQMLQYREADGPFEPYMVKVSDECVDIVADWWPKTFRDKVEDTAPYVARIAQFRTGLPRLVRMKIAEFDPRPGIRSRVESCDIEELVARGAFLHLRANLGGPFPYGQVYRQRHGDRAVNAQFDKVFEEIARERCFRQWPLVLSRLPKSAKVSEAFSIMETGFRQALDKVAR